MAAAGANIIDIGGQSTRPGAERVSEQEERDRVVPVIRCVRQHPTLPTAVQQGRTPPSPSTRKGFTLPASTSTGRILRILRPPSLSTRTNSETRSSTSTSKGRAREDTRLRLG